MKRIQFIFAFFLAVTVMNAQKPTDVLLTIDGEPVYVGEFERVYNKNLDLVKDESQKTIDGYLDLFIDYKLKVAEARNQNLDERRMYNLEYKKYRNQLSRNYLNETRLIDGMVEEAYERGKEQINANHILIQVGYDAPPKDTLAAYNKIKNIRDKAIAGEDFVSLAKEYSEEPGAKERGGDLGYFTVFSMVYPFETMAYNTPVGEISDIVRTSFGYHIIKVNDRRNREQQLVVSHIMITDKKNDDTFDAEKRIKEISQMVRQGSDFADLAKQFSDDKNSGKIGGRLKPFTKGQLRSEIFENTAYNLNNIGDVSAPIKSDFGWHIIKLEDRVAPRTFEEQKEDLYNKIKNGDRSKTVSTQVLQDIIDKYGIERYDYLDFFQEYVSDDLMKRSWKITDTLKGDRNKVVFKIGDKNLTYFDFADYIERRQRFIKKKPTKKEVLEEIGSDFEGVELKKYLVDQLEIENPEFAAVLGEYRDGLLIFDVMNKNVWLKAKNDSIGLKDYYNKVSSDYTWGERINAEILSGSDQSKIQQAKAMLQTGKNAEDIKSALNTNGKVNIIISTGLYEKDDAVLPEGLNFKTGVSNVLANGKTYSVVRINEVLAPAAKTFDEVKGRIMSEYQNQIEEEWIASLRTKYDVAINKKVLKKLKKRY